MLFSKMFKMKGNYMLQKTLQIFFIATFCMAGMISFAQAELNYDIRKGEYKRKDEQKKYIVGKIVNIAYELQHRPGGADSQDSLFSKGRQGLQTSDKSIWTFVDNIKGQDLQWNKKYLGKFVNVEGWIFYDAQYIEIDKFTIDGINYDFSTTESAFLPVKDN